MPKKLLSFQRPEPTFKKARTAEIKLCAPENRKRVIQSDHPALFKMDLSKCPKLHAKAIAWRESKGPNVADSDADEHDLASEHSQCAGPELVSLSNPIRGSQVACTGVQGTALATGTGSCGASLPLRARGPYARAAS